MMARSIGPRRGTSVCSRTLRRAQRLALTCTRRSYCGGEEFPSMCFIESVVIFNHGVFWSSHSLVHSDTRRSKSSQHYSLNETSQMYKEVICIRRSGGASCVRAGDKRLVASYILRFINRRASAAAKFGADPRATLDLHRFVFARGAGCSEVPRDEVYESLEGARQAFGQIHGHGGSSGGGSGGSSGECRCIQQHGQRLFRTCHLGCRVDGEHWG